MKDGSLPSVKVKRLTPKAVLPRYMTEGAAGMDLFAAMDSVVELEPGERLLVPTGIAIELPKGHEGQVRPRSGLATKTGVTVVNSPGTIDEDYRGEVKVALVNLGREKISIEPGMRIAQLVVNPVTRVKIYEVQDLSETERASGGFGHTDHRS
ncbi:MAG: dUTP diphosphatase [Pseudomonadota bacterium]